MSERPNRDQDLNLGRRVASGAGWMVALRSIDRLIGLVSVAILARILVPDDFGIIGYAMLVLAFLELFTGISTDTELIRHRQADRGYYDAAWTMNIMKGFAIGFLMIALVSPAAEFFHEPKLVAIILALAAIPVIQGFENIGVVDFRKRMEFDREFRFLLTSRVLGTAAVIVLAFALRNYWALALGSVLRTALRVGLSYWFHPFRPRMAWARVPEIFRFSRWMMLQNLLGGVNDKLPALVIGRELSSSALAFFNMGKEIADLATTEIRAPIRRVLYPGLAQIADRQQRLSAVLVESTGMLAILTLPIPLGIALVADDLVAVFLGAQWQPMVSVLQPLCVAASLAALGSNSQLGYMALNRAHLTVIAAVLRLLLLASLLAVVPTAYGLIGVAYVVASVTCVMLVADYVVSARILGIGGTRLVLAVWRPLIASLAMCAAVWLMRSEMPPATDLLAHAWLLVSSTVVGAFVYVAALLGLWTIDGRKDGAERRLISFATHQFARFGRDPR